MTTTLEVQLDWRFNGAIFVVEDDHVIKYAGCIFAAAQQGRVEI